MMSVRQTAARSLAAGFLVAALTGAASAGSVDIASDVSNSTEGLGAFEGTLSYSYDDFFDIGTLVVELTNTSDPSNGGFITAFLFNIDSTDDDASAELTDASHDAFRNATGKGLNGMPFGRRFDAGAGLRGKFQGGGNPAGGVAVGDTGIFTFEVTADDAADLDAINFVEGPHDFNFVVRFRGFEDGGSDKTPAAVVPLPAPFLLGLAGVPLAIIARRRSAANRSAS